MFGEKRVEKKKTPVYKCNLNPIFNATFEFDVPWEQIRDCSLDVQVMDFDTVGRNELIGKLLLNCELLTHQAPVKYEVIFSRMVSVHPYVPLSQNNKHTLQL